MEQNSTSRKIKVFNIQIQNVEDQKEAYRYQVKIEDTISEAVDAPNENSENSVIASIARFLHL